MDEADNHARLRLAKTSRASVRPPTCWLTAHDPGCAAMAGGSNTCRLRSGLPHRVRSSQRPL